MPNSAPADETVEIEPLELPGQPSADPCGDVQIDLAAAEVALNEAEAMTAKALELREGLFERAQECLDKQARRVEDARAKFDKPLFGYKSGGSEINLNMPRRGAWAAGGSVLGTLALLLVLWLVGSFDEVDPVEVERWQTQTVTTPAAAYDVTIDLSKISASYRYLVGQVLTPGGARLNLTLAQVKAATAAAKVDGVKLKLRVHPDGKIEVLP